VKGFIGTNIVLKFRKFNIVVLISILVLIPILLNQKIPYSNIRGHSPFTTPTEIFSFYNDTLTPTIDGKINFNTSDTNSEWSPAAIYNLYNKESVTFSKLIIQNNNSKLFIGLDCIDFQTETPTTIWGFGIYLDRDHNGILSILDRAIYFKVNGGTQTVSYNQYSIVLNDWDEIESGLPGISLASSNILVNKGFSNSTFESIFHRQYEISIPLTLIVSAQTNITGFAIEAFENFNGGEEEITWPSINVDPSNIRLNAKLWGDLSIGKNVWVEPYVIEKNFNIDSLSSPLSDGDNPFLGKNNGTFLLTADIDGNGDLELIASSNRSIIGEDYKIAIYDYVDGKIDYIWRSWLSTHNSKMFLVRGIAAGDFDGDIKEELYLVGDDSRILRLSEWNSVTNEFDLAEYVFSHTSGLMGYIAVGDIIPDGNLNLVFGDQNGEVSVLSYDSDTDTYSHYNNRYSPFSPIVDGAKAFRIHAIKVGNVDSDGGEEILFLSQTTSDNTISTTQLQIYVYNVNRKVQDNFNDNLPYDSTAITEDSFGHSIIVADVDNDATKEIIIVGKEYLKIFGINTFTNPSAPLVLDINDESSPAMGGGAAVFDLDGDSDNELIVGCNNGTIIIYRITDLNSNPDIEDLTYSIEWSGDFGSSPGKRNSILFYDIDKDGDNEIIFGDNLGQIFIIGKSAPPSVSIISPTTAQSFNSLNVKINWTGTDDLAIHHYQIYVNDLLQGKVHGSQTQYIVILDGGLLNNIIEIVAFDVNCKNSTSSVTVKYTANAPEVYINSPDNNFLTSASSIRIEFSIIDYYLTVDFYEIWANDFLINNITEISGSDFYADIELLFDGQYNITVLAGNNLGYKGTSSIFITRDNGIPSLEITFPLTGTATKYSTVDLHWTASDALAGISHFVVKKDGISLISTTSNSYTIPLEYDKSYVLEVIAYDKVDNFNTKAVVITKDTIRPTVEFISPQFGTIFSSSDVTLIWESRDNIGGTNIHHSEITVNQITKYTGSSETSITLNLGENGVKDIVITTYDNAGNSGIDYLSIIVDNSNPFIEIISPTQDYETSFDYVYLNWYSYDTGSGISRYEILVNGVLNQTITDSTIKVSQVPIFIDQSSVITIRAFDFLNHTYEDSITINQNPSSTTLILTDPLEYTSYSSTSIFEISWEISNVVGFIKYEVFVNETSKVNITNINTKTYLIDLSGIPIDEYPLYNITVVVVTSTNYYFDNKWIIIDQMNPYVTIFTPSNNTVILNSLVYIQWSGNDEGTGILKYNIKLDEELLSTCSSIKNYYYLLLDPQDGYYSITVEAFDKANNIAKYSIIILVYIALPEFSTNIPTTFYTKTGVFQFNLSITNPQSGIKNLIIQLDDIDLLKENYESSIRHDAFMISIAINDTTYQTLVGTHALGVSITDFYSRELLEIFTINVDQTRPEILDSISFGSQILSDVPLKFIYGNKQNFTITLTVTDNFAVDKVYLTILGSETNITHEMLHIDENLEVAQFSITINISNLLVGNYQLIFTSYDMAGNSFQLSHNITIIQEEIIPWFLRGNNAIYFSFGMILLAALISISIVLVRIPILNKNWQEEMIAVIYIKKTGLTCTYVPYIPLLIQEEQLIGGAMIAVQGVLEEITGAEERQTLETMELGNKSLIIILGEFGLSVSIVSKIKPIHKTKLKAFSKEFETKYNDALRTVYVDSNSFEGSVKIVEKYFGTLDNGARIAQLGIAEQLVDIKNEKESKQQFNIIEQNLVEKKETPIEKLLKSISKEAKRSLIKVIRNAPDIIIALTEEEFDSAEELINSVTQDLEFLLKIERTNKELNILINTILNFTKEAYFGVDSARKGNLRMLELAIEKISELWFDEIAEKWSNLG